MPSTSACDAPPPRPPFHLASLKSPFGPKASYTFIISRNLWVFIFHNLNCQNVPFSFCIAFNGLGSNLEVNLIIIKVFPGPQISRRHKWPYLASNPSPHPIPPPACGCVLRPYWIWNPTKPWYHKLKSHTWFRSKNLIKAFHVVILRTFDSLGSCGWGAIYWILKFTPT